MTVSVKENQLNLIIEQGKSDDGSINAVAQIITEDTTLDGGLSFVDLADTPKSLSGEAGKAIIVNQEENKLEFSELRPSAFTSLSDTFRSYQGKANQVLAVSSDESKITTINVSEGEIKYFSQLADVGVMSVNADKLLKVNSLGTEIEYVEGANLLSDIPGLVPDGQLNASYANPTVTVNSKGQIIAITTGTSANTNNCQANGIVYVIENPAGQGLVLRSTDAMTDDDIVVKMPGFVYPINDKLTFLYSSSKKKRALVMTDAVQSEVDNLPVLAINRSLNSIQFDAQSSGIQSTFDFLKPIMSDEVITPSVSTSQDTLKLSSLSDIVIDPSSMPDGVYNPKTDDSVLTVRHAISILKEKLGGLIVGGSNHTSVDLSTVEFNTQFLIGAPSIDSEFKLQPGQHLLNCSYRIITAFSSNLQFWIGSLDENPVSHPNNSAYFGQFDLPTELGAYRQEILLSRPSEVVLAGMIYNPAVPPKSGVYLGDFNSLADLQAQYATTTEGNYAVVGASAITYVYSTTEGWMKNTGTGAFDVFVQYEF